jgi:hypothetical protein
MSDDLARAVEAALARARACSQSTYWNRSQVDDWCSLADHIYRLALADGRAEKAFPKVEELKPELESRLGPPLSPVQFISKLNLPGDWWPDNAVATDRAFQPCPTQRWFEAMISLLALARESPPIPLRPSAGPSGQPDNQPDRTREKIPQNPKVRRLIRAINNPRNDTTTIIDLAKEIAEENPTEAASLDRQARRFKHLWANPARLEQ